MIAHKHFFRLSVEVDKPKLPLSLSLSPSRFLSLSLSVSLFSLFSLSLSLSLSLLIFLFCSLCLSLFLTHTHSLSLSLSLSPFFSPSFFHRRLNLPSLVLTGSQPRKLSKSRAVLRVRYTSREEVSRMRLKFAVKMLKTF